MFNMEIAKKLATQYSIPVVDVLLIALNRYGVMADIDDNRIRFKVKLNVAKEVYYFAVCVNTYESPFTLTEDGQLLFNNEKIGDIIDIEKDTCDSTYFRRNRTELTLNSNMRSQCRGCKFCGSYNLNAEDLFDLTTEQKVSDYLEALLKANNMKDFSSIVRVTICTGCFENEDELVNHIIMVNKVLRQYGFNKRIRYIGSQLRSDKAMDRIQKNVESFSLSMTTECFSRRDEMMRQEKGELNVDRINEILEKGRKHGFSTNFLYILGLDSLDVMEDGMRTLKKNINRFPVIQILQNYLKEQESYRIDEAKEIEYYLQARQRIENIFGDQMYKPRSWENYRSLFYESYNNEAYKCIRI